MKYKCGVPETIAAPLKSNNLIWIHTGDEQETAINIDHSSELIAQEIVLNTLNEKSLDVSNFTRTMLTRQ